MQETEKLQITYNLSLEDLASVFVYQNAPSAEMKRKYSQSCVLVGVGVFVAFTFGFSVLLGWDIMGAVRCATLAGAFATYSYWRYYRKLEIESLRQQAVVLYTNNFYPGLIGEHTLEIDANGIVHKSSVCRSEYIWEALHKIEFTDGYTLLHIASLVFTLHPTSVTSGNLSTFLEGVTKYHKTATQITT
jgi:hypothetical protein